MKKVSFYLLCVLFFMVGRAYAQEEGQEQTQVQSQEQTQVQEQAQEQSQEQTQVQNPEQTQVQSQEQSKIQSQEQDTAPVDPQQELINKIEELEKKINELTEESKARRKLEITEEEKQQKEKEILEAVSSEYTLDPKHTLGLEYNFSYSYAPGERILNQLLLERQINHTIRHTITTSYGVLDNLSVSTSVPFVYRYYKVGTDNEMDETDIGDISIGFATEPFKTKADEMRKNFGLSVNLPTGRSPYKINPDSELSTGSGYYAVSASGSFSKVIDPVVAFWNVGYNYAFDVNDARYRLSETYILEKVETGNSISFGAGLAYAMSYKISVNSSFSYSYNFGSKLHYENATSVAKTGDSASGSIGFGVGWKVSQKTTVSFSLGYGLTGSGFSLSFRLPFSYVL